MSEHITLQEALTILAKNDDVAWLRSTYATKEDLQWALSELFLDERDDKKARFYQTVMNRLN